MTDPLPDPPHPILERPWTWDVVALHIDLLAKEVIMSMRRGAESLTLSFTGVQQLCIDEGYDGANSGMEITDCSASGMETARVRVGSFESDPAIRFWATDVERIAVPGPVADT